MERKTWEEKNDVLTKKLTRAHAEVLHEREMWQIFRERLLKEKAAVEERYYAAKADSRRMIQDQLDKSIEAERTLQRDLQELTEYTLGLEKDNKRLEQKQRKSSKAAKH